jgi:hypothetical protein
MVVQLLPLFVMLAASPLIIVQMRAYNQLVRIGLERYHEDWVDEGRPQMLPFRFGSRRTLSMRSWLSTQRCMFTWLLVPPKWCRWNTEAARWATRMRLCFVLFILVALPVFVLSALIASAYN